MVSYLLSARVPRAAVLSFCVLLPGLVLSPRSSRADGYEAMLLIPLEVQSGGRSAATITAVETASMSPANLPVYVYLVKSGDELMLLRSGSTGTDGHVTLSFDVPSVPPGAYDIRAIVAGVSETLSGPTTVTEAPAILIETDKPIYKPSQTIRGRAVLLDNALRPRAGDVEVTFYDAKNIRIDRKNVTAGEYGVAPFELRLANEVNFGVWKIVAAAGGKESSRDVRVENYVLPRFDLVAQMPRSWVLVDESIAGRVEAEYFFGKPVAGQVEIAAQRYVGAWETYDTASGELSDGQFEFQLDPVGFVAGTPGSGGLGTVQLEISLTDSTGHSQSTTEVLTVSPSSTVVQLISGQRTIKPGMQAEFYVVTETPDGLPRDATVSLVARFLTLWGETIAESQSTINTIDGLGDLAIAVPEDASRLELTGSVQVDGRTASTSLTLNASYSPNSSFLSVRRLGDGAAQVGEEIAFRATSTHPGTIFYDVFAGGRTIFSGTAAAREIRFDVTADMAPAARVVAYVINPDSEVAVDTVPFDVELPSAISIDTLVSPEDLRPGDEVTLTVNAGEQAMVGLSVVDCSVLALGRSRLHLGEVFAELERRFMEPQAETHEDPNGGGFGGDVFWGGWTEPGARDLFESAGLLAVSSRGLLVPVKRDAFRDFAEDFDGGVGPPEAAPGGADPQADDGGAPDAVRVRQYFPETWVWEPELLTDDSGFAMLSLTAPDSITCWEINAVGTSASGIGFGSGKSTVFQEFFVEPNLPVAVTRGEEFPVSVQIFNYLDSAQTVDLQFGSGDWFELLGESEAVVEVPANSAIAAHFPIRPTQVGEHEVKVVAVGSVLSDAVIRVLKVEPEGLPVEEVENTVVEAGQTQTLNTSLPPHVISDSGRAFLHITPSPISQTLQGISNLLNMPSGCGEQNMIFLAPDVEILRYIKATGLIMPEVHAQAEHFINVGYQRELTYQTDDGGFAAFGGAEGSLWLTAFVLSTFSVARDVRDIDETVLSRAAGMLVGRQNADGSFRTDDFLIHKEMDGGLSNLYAMTAYVANALADYGDASVDAPVQKAAQYLAAQRTTVNDDAYALSIAAVALGKISGSEGTATATVDRLLELAITEGIGIHWEPYPIETTGYTVLALLEQSRPQAAAAVDWITTQRNSLGGYGQSTQDTVVAIRALTEAALKVRADLNLTLTVSDGGTQLASLTVDDTNLDLLQTVQLPVGRPEGLTLSSQGSGNVGYQVVRRYNVPGDFLPPPRDMTLSVIYDAEGIEVDDLVDVRVRVEYTGFKEKTGMTIVDVGVPTGFQTVRSTLDSLIEAEIASRIDTAGRKVIIYIDELSRGTPLAFSFQVKALYPVRAEPPISEAYEYYDRDVQASDRGPVLVVKPPTTDPELFIRGDSNEDDALDVSDAVDNLFYQFLGTDPPACRDRLDANDDGNVDVFDPIRILQHLFLGEDPPPAPFPTAGVDPTPDNLDC